MNRRLWIVAATVAMLLPGLASPASALPTTPPNGPPAPRPRPTDCLGGATASLDWSAGPVAIGQPTLVGQMITVSWTTSIPAAPDCVGLTRQIDGPCFSPHAHLPAKGSQHVVVSEVGRARWSMRMSARGTSTTAATTSAPVHRLPSFSPIAAALDFTGHMNVIRARSDDVILRDERVASDGNRFPGWHVAPGFLRSVAAERDGSGVIVEAGVNAAGQIFVSKQDHAGGTTWSDWQQLGGGLLSVALARNASGKLELLGSNLYGQVYRSTQTATGTLGWTQWTAMDGPPMQSVAAETNADGRITMVGIGVNRVPAFRSQRTVDSSDWDAWS